MDRFVGKKLDGRYEIEGLIGIGGMANVYRAYDVIDDRIVAVKILRDEHMGNDELQRRFRNESKAISVLSHPNIVKVFDVSFNDKVQYIVMEYIDGITLKEYIEQQGVIKWKDAVHFLVQILRALQHAHDKGIVHRDIKPQNMMLLRDGTIKVTDFGIARFARNDDSTLSDRTIGSVHYISPEQARGDVTDGRTDIYSVGVMMYEMLTGQLPFDADTPVSVALKQIELEPKRPREINPAIPEGLEAIVMWAMQKDVNKRYQSAAEMLRDLDEFRRDPTISNEYLRPQKTREPERTAPVTRRAPGIVERAEQRSSAEDAQTERKLGIRERMAMRYTETVEEAESRRKLSPILPVLFGVMMAFIVVSVLFIAAMFKIVDPLAKTEDVVVPKLIGVEFDSLKGNKDYGMFQFEVAQPDYNDDYQKGYIYDQEPRYGRTVKAGSKITVYVSLGPNKLIMPNVTNYDLTSAYQMLADYNVTCTPIEEYSDLSEGFVIRTDPAAGEELRSGSEVIIYVSRGSQSQIISVPDVTGMTLSGAKTYLAAYGLKVGIVKKVENSADAGTVVAQYPSEGESIEKGGYVNLDISEGGPEEAAVISMKVALPSLTKKVILTASISSDAEEDDASDKLQDTWEPGEGLIWAFEVSGSGIGSVHIYIDDEIYKVYQVDFDDMSYKQIADYSADFGGTTSQSDEASESSEDQSSEEGSESEGEASDE